MDLINTHSHTTYCGHAVNTMEDMVEAASRKGISLYAVTEHYPLLPPFDTWGYVSMPYHKLDDYVAEVERLRQKHPEMTILTGVEVDWLGDLENRPLQEEDWSRFDIVLGSVHYVDGWAFDDPSLKKTWEHMGVDDCWKRYFQVWCEAVTSDAPFTVMSHPDLIKKFDYWPSFDLLPLYKQAAEAAASSGRLIEVNTSGKYYACGQYFPAPDLLREFCKAGVPCTVGTDCHQVDHVDRDIREAYKYMYEAGYRYVTVPQPGGEVRRMPIE